MSCPGFDNSTWFHFLPMLMPPDTGQAAPCVLIKDSNPTDALILCMAKY